jgi:hypothetical protein
MKCENLFVGKIWFDGSIESSWLFPFGISEMIFQDSSFSQLN